MTKILYSSSSQADMVTTPRQCMGVEEEVQMLGGKMTRLPIQVRKEGIRLLFREKGFRVFPLRAGTKTPAIDSWDDASQEQTDQAFRQLSDYNIAIMCGSGLTILDFEKESDFLAFYDGGKRILNSTLVVRTAHGGAHVYLKTDENIRRHIRFCEDHPLDILGAGGYAVAPSSVIDHSKCDRSKCGEIELSRYEVMSTTYDILQVEQLLESVLRRGNRLGWKMGRPHDSPEGGHGELPINVTTFGKMQESPPPCVTTILEGVPEGYRDRATFLLGNYMASWGWKKRRLYQHLALGVE